MSNTPQRASFCELLKSLKKENQKETPERWGEGWVGVSALLRSQLPILLAALLLLDGFQAAFALGFCSTAGCFAKSTGQARQLDLLHVFYSFILGILQQISLALQTRTNIYQRRKLWTRRNLSDITLYISATPQ